MQKKLSSKEGLIISAARFAKFSLNKILKSSQRKAMATNISIITIIKKCRIFKVSVLLMHINFEG